MSKLEEALQEAEGDNIAEAAYDKASELAKDKAKKEGAKLAKKGGKKALGGVKSAVRSGAKAVVSGAKNAAKGAAAFVKSGPVGWVIGGLVVLVIVSSGSGGDKDSSSTGEDVSSSSEVVGGLGVDGGMSVEEEAAAILSIEECPPEDYADYSSNSGTSGDLSDPNSIYYKNAKQTFDIWVEGGLSGAAAAGIVGWTMGEGGFYMVGRAEGHYGSNDPRDASIKYGNVPRNYAFPSKPGGGGIYQFTPYTKYAPLGDDSWEDIIAMHKHMFNIMADTGPSWEESPDWIARMDYTGGNHSFRQFAEHSDPKKTVLMWNAHERMSDQVFQSRNLRAVKERDAQMIYDLFGGAKYPFNAAKFEANFGRGGAKGGGSKKTDANSKNSKIIKAIVDEAHSLLGSRYVWGSADPSVGLDCSGLLYYLYQKHAGITLNRTSYQMVNDGYEVSRDSLEPGDILLFNSGGNSRISHVGLYVGDGEMIHASSPSTGIIKDNVVTGFHAARFVTARRILDGGSQGINDPCIEVIVEGSPWGGVGGQPSITSGVFVYNQLPDELKKYALNLELLPLRYGQAEDWQWNTSFDHMQCVDLTSNLIKLIWEKDGKPIGNTKSMGNGREVVGNYVRRFGGSSSKEPSAGAVFSETTGVTMCGGSLCGHTGVVSHVFDNGDFLIIEQNFGSYSGRGAGPNTYNYRYVQKGAIARNNFTFYDPSTSGHNLVSGLKSL